MPERNKEEGIALFCPYCHSEIPDNLIFCPECGERLPEQKGKRGWKGRDRDSRIRRLIGWGIALAVVFVVTGGTVPRLIRPAGEIRPTAAPAATQTPSEKLGIRTAEPVRATTAPVQTAAPFATAAPVATAAPTVKPAGTPDPRPANLPRQISTIEDASALLEWMVDTYTLEAPLNGFEISEDQMTTAMRRHPGVASWVAYDTKLILELDPGVGAAAAVRNGKEHLLPPEHAVIAQQAKQIVASVITPGMTDLQKEVAIHDYIIYHCDYVINENLNTGDARGFFNHASVQCAGYSDTFQLLGSLCGLEIDAVSGDIVGETGGHEWNLIRLDGLWYGVDCTWDDPEGGGQEGHLYLNFPHHQLDYDHIYDHAALPEGAYAQDFDRNYYPTAQGLTVRNYAEAEQLIQKQLAQTGGAMVYSLAGKMDLHPILTKYIAPRGNRYPYTVWESDSSISAIRYRVEVE